MNNKLRLINKYKHCITTRKKLSLSEFSYYLEEELSAILIDYMLFDNIFRNIILKSIGMYIKEQKLDIPCEELDFIAYRIPSNGFGSRYYKYKHTNVNISNQEDDSIYVILEKHIDNYLFCNCNKLLLDLAIKRGISKYDYENNTLKLIEYLSLIEANDKHWY